MKLIRYTHQRMSLPWPEQLPGQKSTSHASPRQPVSHVHVPAIIGFFMYTSLSCEYIRMRECKHERTYIQILNAHVLLWLSVCKRMYIHIHECICMNVHGLDMLELLSLCVHACMHVCMYVYCRGAYTSLCNQVMYACMHVYMYACMYVRDSIT
jgi:hypothetical protein